jgi:VanZ family protein
VVAVYVPLAHFLWARRHPVRRMVLACGAYALLMEVLQIPVEGRTFDITEALIAGFAALLVSAFWNQASIR